MGIMLGLMKLGVSASAANTLEDTYAQNDAREFLDGIELVANEVADLVPAAAVAPPPGEPWLGIHTRIQKSGLAPEDAFLEAVKALDPENMNAVIDAVLRLSMLAKEWQTVQSQAGNRRKYAEYVKALKTLGYYFCLNLCSDDLEVNGEKMSDTLRAVIRSKARDLGFWDVNVLEDVWTAEGSYNRYHPVRDYLLSLSWDGKPHIATLAGYFVDAQGVFATWLRRWLLGAVGRALDYTQNKMLVLDGAQGIGKSLFAKWLASPLAQYFIEAPINTDDKDMFLRLANKWIWEVSELGCTTRRADREALNSFLTLNTVTVRKAYGRYDITKPALANFIGTVNNDGAGILNDPTGSRRFIIARIEKIDWAYAGLLAC